MKTVLITGAAGFIGSHLAEVLLDEGCRVYGVDNLNDYYSPAIKRARLRQLKNKNRFSFSTADIRDKLRLRRLMGKKKKVDVVVHLAAEVGVRPSFERAEDYLEVNAGGTLNLLELMRDRRMGQLIFASSSSVYGNTDQVPFRENVLAEPISPYGASKMAAEHLCHVWAKEFGIKTTVLRLFTVYGPRNRPDMAAFKFLERIIKGKPISVFGWGTKRDFTFVADIVEGIKRAIEKPLDFEVINLGGNQPVLVSQFIKQLERLTGKKAKKRRQALPAGDMRQTFADISKAKRLLDWQPTTSLNEGLEQLVSWYKQNV